VDINISDNANPNKKTVSAEYSLDTDLSAIDRLNLGKTPQTCRVCFASGEFQTWLAIEMFFGTKDKFKYFECPVCETLQIEEFPDNIEKYYAHDYYSYQVPQIKPVRYGAAADTRMILDVGCGAGTWLCYLASEGCTNLYGCDPFIEKNLTYANGVKIKKCTIHEIGGSYDVIHLFHSFEHMPDPREAFKSFDRLLKRGRGDQKEDPKIEIAIPVFPNAAFDVYGPYWYQMDPPRHYFLHSVKSMKMLAEENGFNVSSVQYIGSGKQFYVSRMYQLGVPYMQHERRLNNDPEFAGLKNQIDALNDLSHPLIIAKKTDEAFFTLHRA